jgi:hypothetical protein
MAVLSQEPARFCAELNHPQRRADLISVFYECQLLRRTVGVSGLALQANQLSQTHDPRFLARQV